jgi:hypothetical protein
MTYCDQTHTLLHQQSHTYTRTHKRVHARRDLPDQLLSDPIFQHLARVQFDDSHKSCLHAQYALREDGHLGWWVVCDGRCREVNFSIHTYSPTCLYIPAHVLYNHTLIHTLSQTTLAGYLVRRLGECVPLFQLRKVFEMFSLDFGG